MQPWYEYILTVTALQLVSPDTMAFTVEDMVAGFGAIAIEGVPVHDAKADDTPTDDGVDVIELDAESFALSSKLYVPVFVSELVANLQVTVFTEAQSTAFVNNAAPGASSSHWYV